MAIQDSLQKLLYLVNDAIRDNRSKQVGRVLVRGCGVCCCVHGLFGCGLCRCDVVCWVSFALHSPLEQNRLQTTRWPHPNRKGRSMISFRVRNCPYFVDYKLKVCQNGFVSEGLDFPILSFFLLWYSILRSQKIFQTSSFEIESTKCIVPKDFGACMMCGN